MKTTFRILLAIIIGFAFTMATGCATKPKMHQTGFLKDYSQLKENPKGLVQWTYFKKDGVDFGAYDKVIVDYITFFFKEDAKYKGIHPEELIEVAQYFNNAYVEALSGALTFTDKPGPGVLRLRTAITDLVPGKPVLGTWSTIMPPALVISHVKKATTGSHMGMGSVSFEIEAIDSQTDEVLGSAIAKNEGKKYRVGKTFSKWGQVEAIFDDFAKLTRKRFEKLGGRE
jgi:hypothetical protein